MIEGYLPLLLTFIVASLGVLLMLKISHFLAPKKYEKYKNETYECGEVTIGDSKGPVKLQYYMVLLIFVIFDVEIIFLIPWANYIKLLGSIAILEGFIFIAMLIFALYYVFEKGFMEWK